ncbi:CocE/NonD family hydrolase [Streptomyces sp. NPDC002144]
MTDQVRPFRRPEAPGVAIERDVEILARDGVRLRVDIYHPEDWSEVAYPALLAVSGYQKELAGLPAVPAYPFRETGPIEWYVQRGYVYVLADARGTGRSDGEWDFLGPQERTDLYDMIEWTAAQTWSSGRVGMIGQSYYGMIQWLAALEKPPHLTCIAPYDALVDNYRDNVFHGGIPCNFAAAWDMVLRANHVWGPDSDRGLRFRTSPVDALLEHPTDDDFWRSRAAHPRLHEVEIPVLSVGNWGKNSTHTRGNILGYEQVSGVKRLCMQAGAQPASLNVAKALLDFDSIEFHEAILAPWYDYWLRGVENGVLDTPPVSVHVSGVEEERHFQEWPPAAAEENSLFLAAGTDTPTRSLNDGLLLTETDIGAAECTEYTYPDPLWHLGTATVTSLGVPNPVARVLTFGTPPLNEEITSIGLSHLELYLSSDQPDTDVIVHLCDEAPRPADLHPELPTPFTIVSKGWLRASHRELDPTVSTPTRPYHRHDRPQPLHPHQVYRLDIELMPMAHVFKKGHRIRVDIANGDSSVTEGVFSHFYSPRCGSDTIHHSQQYPSRLALSILDGDARN